jgi:peptidoglycan-N-acetylglucosamine deacetylase
MYLVKTPKLMQALMPSHLWQVDTPNRSIFLTFDDGPIPEVTPWVLDQLAAHNAKATFFCVGENVAKHPVIYERILAEGHAVGNHTYNHLNGWHTDTAPYCHNIRQCAHVVKSELFRPPYGRTTAGQRKYLQRHYRTVMWDVLSGDFDPALTPDDCLRHVMDNTERGSIVVFHDSLKAEEKLRHVLPQVLAHFASEGFVFEALNSKMTQKSAFSWLGMVAAE